MGMTVLRKGGSTPVASDDRILFDKIFDSAGIITGGGATMSAVNKIHVPETTAWIKGTEIKIDDQDVTVGLSDSGTKYGRVILVLDWSTEEAAHFEYEIAASASAFRELIQDEDINFSAGIWEEVFATYTCTEASISNVAFCMSTLQDASGGSLIAGSESGALSTQPYAAGQYLIWNGKLKKATAPIAIGDVLAVGTNLSADTTVGNELYALNNSLNNIDLRYTSAGGAEWSERGADTWHPFSGQKMLIWYNTYSDYKIHYCKIVDTRTWEVIEDLTPFLPGITYTWIKNDEIDFQSDYVETISGNTVPPSGPNAGANFIFFKLKCPSRCTSGGYSSYVNPTVIDNITPAHTIIGKYYTQERMEILLYD